MLRSVLVLLALLLSAHSANANESESAHALSLDFPVERYQLPNGLTVLLVEDHRVPMISYHTWYKVGSRDEHEGITGSAHMLEHMMFQGSKKYSGKEFHAIMEKNGIDFNAFTSNDYTGFYMDLPASKLEMIMDVEVDRMSSLAIDGKNLQSEREVVKEERRWRVDNNPHGLMNELTMSTVFAQSSYHWPVIGWMKDIEKYTPETLRSFYEKYYVASNAVLVIAGDFDPARAKKLVEKYYGPLPLKPVPERVKTVEPEETKPRFAELRKDVQGLSFSIDYPTVPDGDPDSYALDAAATAMSAGSSGRLHRTLVYKKQWAVAASASHATYQDVGVFTAGASLRPGMAMAPSLNVVAGEIARLQKVKLTDDEMKKIRTVRIKGYVDGLQTNEAKARALAAAEIIRGSYRTLFDDLDKYMKVTADDIQRVALKYLVKPHRSLIVLQPDAGQSAKVVK